MQHLITPISAHIPYRLEILTKEHGVVLCEACVVFDNTPVIDQIIAISMFIKSNCEDELLEKANFFATKDEFWTNSEMSKILEKSKFKEPPSQMDDILERVEMHQENMLFGDTD